MGCDVSYEFDMPKKTRSPVVRNISNEDKQKIIDAIEDDNLVQMVTTMDALGAYPNSEISETDMRWMLTHLCCRWDADECLQYLLKEYFSTYPRGYANFVNAHVLEGETCLHLCATWKSEKCFRVLHYYGGLDLEARDRMFKTPEETASEYKFAEMANLLKQYKDIGVKFTNIEAEKLMSGSIITDGSTIRQSNKKETITIDKSLYQMTDSLFDFTAEQKKIDEQRALLEAEKQKLLQCKLKKQLEADKKRAEARMQQLSDAADEAERIQRQKVIQKKIQQQLARQQQELNKQLKAKEEELRKMAEEKRRAEQAQLQKRKQEQMKKAEELMQRNQEELEKRRLQKIQMMKKLAEEAEKQQKKVKEVVLVKPIETLQKVINVDLPTDILKQYEEAKAAGKFQDKQFPAKNSTIGDPSKTNFKNLIENLVWLRPEQIFKSDFKLFDGIDPNDIKQGSLGVCYMLATVSALASNPKNIEKLFVFSDLSIGFYVLKLYINGKPKLIIVDDQIPCNKLSKSPLFTKPTGNEIWVLLLEKAWAKAIGTYLGAEAMTPDHMMQDLSGAPGYGAWLTKQQQRSQSEKIKQIVRRSQLGEIVVVTSGDKKIQGIANNHAYSMLQAFEYNERYLFKIRNPWGKFEWNGEFGENSSLWTPELRAMVNFEKKDDGIFFLSENELLEAFVYYSISEVKPDYVYNFSEFTSAFNENLFYKIKVTKPSDINIRVTQPFDRMVGDPNYKHSPLIFEVGKIISPTEVKFISEGNEKTYWGAKSVHAFDNIYEKVEAGEYFIRIKMLWNNPSKYNSAVAAVYSKQNIIIDKLTKQEGEKYEKLLFISQASKVNRNKTGNGYYKISTMKGQFVFIGETDEPEPHKIVFTFSRGKMSKAELDLSKTSDTTIEIVASKGQPGVGSASRTDPASGGTTGPVSITVTKV